MCSIYGMFTNMWAIMGVTVGTYSKQLQHLDIAWTEHLWTTHHFACRFHCFKPATNPSTILTRAETPLGTAWQCWLVASQLPLVIALKASTFKFRSPHQLHWDLKPRPTRTWNILRGFLKWWYPKMDGLEWKNPKITWMILEVPPWLRKPLHLEVLSQCLFATFNHHAVPSLLIIMLAPKSAFLHSC